MCQISEMITESQIEICTFIYNRQHFEQLKPFISFD